MRLTMRYLVTDLAEDLPAGDNRMETGEMGACVSVIVLWNLAGGTYQNVRGCHGGGGIEIVNAASLIAGVPNVAQTQVYIFAGDDNRSQTSRMGLNTWYRTNIRPSLFNAPVRFYQMVTSATVTRQNVLTVQGRR